MSDEKDKEPAKEPEKEKEPAKEKEPKIDLSKFSPLDHKHEPDAPKPEPKPDAKPENEPKRTPLHSHDKGDDGDTKLEDLPTELIAEISPMGWILILASIGILVGASVWYQRTKQPQAPQVVRQPERNPFNVNRPIPQAFQ